MSPSARPFYRVAQNTPSLLLGSFAVLLASSAFLTGPLAVLLFPASLSLLARIGLQAADRSARLTLPSARAVFLSALITLPWTVAWNLTIAALFVIGDAVERDATLLASAGAAFVVLTVLCIPLLALVAPILVALADNQPFAVALRRGATVAGSRPLDTLRSLVAHMIVPVSFLLAPVGAGHAGFEARRYRDHYPASAPVGEDDETVFMRAPGATFTPSMS